MSWNPSAHRDVFTDALAKEFEMAHDEAEELADVILERFGGGLEVDDESLDADVRSVFYTLEAKRMLSFRRVEYTREDGDHRRAFYWRLRLDALERQHEERHGVSDADVYASLPATAWQHAG